MPSLCSQGLGVRNRGRGVGGGNQELRAFDERYWDDLALDFVADDGDWRAEVFKKHAQEP